MGEFVIYVYNSYKSIEVCILSLCHVQIFCMMSHFLKKLVISI
jgi:hypothetical protein